MPNIEIKARCTNLEGARTIARSLDARHLGLDHQIDTYFFTRAGRLKLRESSISGAMLIPYVRSDVSGPKKSDYALLAIADPALAKRLLSETLGVEAVVEKNRDIYLADNVRIHIDDVKGLGTFLELEAVYQDDSPASVDRETIKVGKLIDAFGIAPEDLLEGSYREGVAAG